MSISTGSISTGSISTGPIRTGSVRSGAAVDPQGPRDVAVARRLLIRGVVSIAAISCFCNLGVLAAPLFNMQVFNRVLPTRDLGTLGTLAIGLAVCLAVYAVMDLLRGLALEALAIRVTRRLALPLLRAVASSQRGAGGPAEALADLETLRAFIAGPSATAPFDIIWAPVLLLVLLTEHWAFAALGVACCAILVALNVLGDTVARRRLLAANQASAAGMRGAAEAIRAAEAVVALGMLPSLARRWQAAQLHTAGLTHRAILHSRLIAALTGTLRMGMTGAMVALGLVLAMNGLTSSGSMVAGNMILARLLLPFQQVATTRRRWIDALAALQRIQAALETPVAIRYAHAMPPPEPCLAVERLVYLPPGSDRATLRGVSFTIEAGMHVAVIGPSSSGKTTLLRLVVGMLAPSGGGVYLDGTNTFLWERESFARHVGYAPQGLALLDETVAENIARLQAPDMAAVVQAARRAGVHRIIAKLPQGYATRLSAGILSTGQRQRVALARALYGRPRLLVLDEPTAFLDRDGEAELLALLATLRREGTTVLVVTHRPAMLKAVDKVLVLQDGLLTRFGPSEEILRAVATPPVRLLPAAAIREAVL